MLGWGREFLLVATPDIPNFGDGLGEGMKAGQFSGRKSSKTSTKASLNRSMFERRINISRPAAMPVCLTCRHLAANLSISPISLSTLAPAASWLSMARKT